MNSKQVKLFIRNKVVETINGLYVTGKDILWLTGISICLFTVFLILGQTHFIIPDAWIPSKIAVDLNSNILEYLGASIVFGCLLSILILFLLALIFQLKGGINDNLKLAKAGTKVKFKFKK